MTGPGPDDGELLDGKLWFRCNGSEMTLGITNSALEEMGTVEKVELPVEGDLFEEGDVVATLLGSTGRLEIITPHPGTIAAANEEAQKNPEMIMEDPLDEGWIVKFSLENSEVTSEE